MRFKEIFKTSLYRFSDYPSLLLVGWVKTFLYILFLAAIMLLGLIVTVTPLLVKKGGLSGLAQSELPEFSIENGVLECEPYILDDPERSMYIHIDPAEKGEPVIPDDYVQAMAASDKIMVVKNGAKIDKLEFSELGKVNKNLVVAFLKAYSNFIYLMLALFIFLGLSFSVLVNAITYALFAHISNLLFIRSSLRFGAVFKLAVFSMTFAAVFNTVFTAVGLRMDAAAPIITMFYLIKGIVSCKKSDGIIIARL